MPLGQSVSTFLSEHFLPNHFFSSDARITLSALALAGKIVVTQISLGTVYTSCCLYIAIYLNNEIGPEGFPAGPATFLLFSHPSLL